MANWFERQWESAKSNPGKYIGGAVGALGGPVGAIVGSKIGGMFDDEKKPTLTVDPKQTAAYERETALRQEAIRQARGRSPRLWRRRRSPCWRWPAGGAEGCWSGR